MTKRGTVTQTGYQIICAHTNKKIYTLKNSLTRKKQIWLPWGHLDHKLEKECEFHLELP